MKLFRMFLVSLALSLIFAGAALAKADVTELYAEALMTGDVESLDKLLAPNYWHVSANGHIQDKEHFLASLKERKLVIDRIRLSNMRSTVMGDVTLVTANGELKGSATPPLPPKEFLGKTTAAHSAGTAHRSHRHTKAAHDPQHPFP